MDTLIEELEMQHVRGPLPNATLSKDQTLANDLKEEAGEDIDIEAEIGESLMSREDQAITFINQVDLFLKHSQSPDPDNETQISTLLS